LTAVNQRCPNNPGGDSRIFLTEAHGERVRARPALASG
jgi:hypothetical protein